MLNIKRTIKFTKEEYQHILSLHANTNINKKGTTLWGDGKNATKAIKNRISVFTIRNQKGRCAYCETYLRPGTAIEHFAPKCRNIEFTFHPKNLFSACSCCNSPAIKGEKPTIIEPSNIKYRKNSFRIVHPYLDNPNEHIFFTDESRIVFDKTRCTQKGLDTITFFKWDSCNAIQQRTINEMSRTLPTDINALISEISTYRK